METSLAQTRMALAVSEAMSIRQSTIEGNHASSAGGGIFNEAALTMYNVTIADNTAAEGGGISMATGAMTAAHVTVAHNTAASGAGIHQSATTHTISNSLITGNIGPETSGGVGTQFSLVRGSSEGILDPAGLANNGGPTGDIQDKPTPTEARMVPKLNFSASP